MTQYNLRVALRNYLLELFPGLQVVNSYGNDISMPADPYILMTGISTRRLGTNRHVYRPLDSNKDTAQPMAIDVQIDIYGEGAEDNINKLTTLWRDAYTNERLKAAGAAPLYHDNPRNATFQNSSHNYEPRWLVMLTIQYDQTVTTVQEFFDNLPITLEHI
jgi:hypothetical protein